MLSTISVPETQGLANTLALQIPPPPTKKKRTISVPVNSDCQLNIFDHCLNQLNEIWRECNQPRNNHEFGQNHIAPTAQYNTDYISQQKRTEE